MRPTIATVAEFGRPTKVSSSMWVHVEGMDRNATFITQKPENGGWLVHRPRSKTWFFVPTEKILCTRRNSSAS